MRMEERERDRKKERGVRYEKEAERKNKEECDVEQEIRSLDRERVRAE